ATRTSGPPARGAGWPPSASPPCAPRWPPPHCAAPATTSSNSTAATAPGRAGTPPRTSPQPRRCDDHCRPALHTSSDHSEELAGRMSDHLVLIDQSGSRHLRLGLVVGAAGAGLRFLALSSRCAFPDQHPAPAPSRKDVPYVQSRHLSHLRQNYLGRLRPARGPSHARRAARPALRRTPGRIHPPRVLRTPARALNRTAASTRLPPPST